MTKLRTWRERRGLTQSEAAARIGTNQSCYSLWETGKRPIPRHCIAAVHRATKIPMKFLLGVP
ncbi:helix-turn-helix domain-containing protein [Aquitalea magnusonii]|uniref:helix-turn-helix domain-containing protein n=1 Tax=Aquitalea magnusonii TaxID=332411 RepID=UPI0009EB9F84